MANKRIKQILVGTTTYDIEDASAAKLASNNTFTGSNTFNKGITSKGSILIPFDNAESHHIGIGDYTGISTGGWGAFLSMDSDKNGNLTLYSAANYAAVIRNRTGLDNFTYDLPDKSGTLALTSDVVANPAASGTTTLTTLQVGSTVYTLPSGGETYKVVELTSSQTTLTDDQYATLTASPFNKIKFYDIIYNFDRESSTEISYTENYLNHGNRITITKATKGITKGSLSSLTSISGYVKNNLDYNVNNAMYALSAYQGKVLNDRLTALENASGGGGVTSVTTSGTGNAVTGASISGSQLTLTKGSTFLTAHQSLASCAKLSANNTFTGTNTFKVADKNNSIEIEPTGISIYSQVGPVGRVPGVVLCSDHPDILVIKSTMSKGFIRFPELRLASAQGETVALKSDIPTIEANPSASGTATLTKLKVGSTVYTLPSGGGGGTAGVSSIGGKTGAITLGAGLSMSNNQLVPKIKNIYLDSSDYLCIETN